MDDKTKHRLIEVLIQSVLQSMLSETKIEVKDKVEGEEQLVFLKEKIWSEIFNNLHLAIATLVMMDDPKNTTIH